MYPVLVYSNNNYKLIAINTTKFKWQLFSFIIQIYQYILDYVIFQLNNITMDSVKWRLFWSPGIQEQSFKVIYITKLSVLKNDVK